MNEQGDLVGIKVIKGKQIQLVIMKLMVFPVLLLPVRIGILSSRM